MCEKTNRKERECRFEQRTAITNGFDKEMTFAETDEKDAQSKDEQAMKMKDFSMLHPKRAGKANKSFHKYGVEQSPTLIARMKPRLKTKMRKTKMKPRWKKMKPRIKKPKSKTMMKHFDNLSLATPLMHSSGQALDSSMIGICVRKRVEQYVTLI